MRPPIYKERRPRRNSEKGRRVAWCSIPRKKYRFVRQYLLGERHRTEPGTSHRQNGISGVDPAKVTEFCNSWLFPHNLVSTTVYRWGSQANWRVHPRESPSCQRRMAYRRQLAESRASRSVKLRFIFPCEKQTGMRRNPPAEDRDRSETAGHVMREFVSCSSR